MQKILLQNRNQIFFANDHKNKQTEIIKYQIMKSTIKKSIKFLCDKNYRFLINAQLGFYNSMPDKEYLMRMFKARMGKELNLNNVKTYNEKLQWLKLYNRNPMHTMMVDKIKVKDYVAKKIGNQYIIPTLEIWNNPNQINFEELPNKFVLKCNHNSGKGMCICKNKANLNFKLVKKDLFKGLKEDYYLKSREWPYKNVPRKILAEKYIEDREGKLIDYKFFCFDGFVYCVMACTERQTGNPKFFFFDKDWELLPIIDYSYYPKSSFNITAPSTLKEMFVIASELSKGLPCVRVDLFSCDEKIYFGELTFFSEAGFDSTFLPDSDNLLGSFINLETVKI